MSRRAGQIGIKAAGWNSTVNRVSTSSDEITPKITIEMSENSFRNLNRVVELMGRLEGAVNRYRGVVSQDVNRMKAVETVMVARDRDLGGMVGGRR
ncbi:MAG: hypothetical protein FWG67_01510 [Defluviitaleaceae bacterium]|nr:hypothetical protein [Defluviitaleaceae bacterium]